MPKQLRLTVIGLALGRGGQRTASVTLTRGATRIDGWMAEVHVEIDGEQLRHGTSGHQDERAAVAAIGDWLKARFAESTMCLAAGGGMVTIVGVDRVREAA